MSFVITWAFVGWAPAWIWSGVREGKSRREEGGGREGEERRAGKGRGRRCSDLWMSSGRDERRKRKGEMEEGGGRRGR